MSDPSRPPPESAYTELLGAILALRADAASDRFDALLAELTAAGLIDPAAARELRWWQRESVRAVGDHLAETLPVSLVSIERARVAATEASLMADRAWRRAAAPRPDPPRPQPPSPPAPGPDEPPPGPGSPGERQQPPAHEPDPLMVDLRTGPDGPRPGREAGAEPDDLPTDAPPEPTDPAASVSREEQTVRAPIASTRRRLLVAGLTVLPDRPTP